MLLSLLVTGLSNPTQPTHPISIQKHSKTLIENAKKKNTQTKNSQKMQKKKKTSQTPTEKPNQTPPHLHELLRQALRPSGQLLLRLPHRRPEAVRRCGGAEGRGHGGAGDGGHGVEEGETPEASPWELKIFNDKFFWFFWFLGWLVGFFCFFVVF